VHRLRRVAAVLLVAALAGTTAAACSGKKSSAGASGPLELYSDNVTWEQGFKDAGEALKKLTGHGLSPAAVPSTANYEQVVRTSVTTKKTKDLVKWWSGYKLQDLASTNTLTDLSDVWNDAEKKGWLDPKLKPAYTFNGKVYGLPMYQSYWVVFYNKPMFAKYNLKPPTTMAEFESVMATLKQNGVTPLYTTQAGGWTSFIMYQSLVAAQSPDFYTSLTENKAKWTDPVSVNALKIWKGWIDKGWTTAPDSDLNDAPARMKEGKVAMVPIGTWDNSDFKKGGLTPGTDYGAFFMPTTSPEVKKSAFVEGGAWVVPKNAPNHEEAVKARPVGAGGVVEVPRRQLGQPHRGARRRVRQGGRRAGEGQRSGAAEPVLRGVPVQARGRLDRSAGRVHGPPRYRRQGAVVDPVVGRHGVGQLEEAGGMTVQTGRTHPVRERLSGAAFLFPAVGLVAVVLLTPFAVTVYRSVFSDGNTPQFNGVTNYARIFEDPILVRALLNTLMWVVGSLLLPVGLGLAVAVMTGQMKGGRLLRLAVVLPYAISGSAVAVVGFFMLQRDGAVNALLTGAGAGELAQPWLLEWPQNTISGILLNTWQGTGVAVVLFLVGLQTIPAETIEAAALDGADGWKRFRYIVFPQLRPVTVVVVGITLANALRAFDVVWVLTQGGPARSSETLALSMYRETFLLQNTGQGAAIAVVLTAIVVGASWIYLRSQLKGGSR
jgi:ABC-type sugar transport system permease subunit/ABC-type glycerol-3-phosphate transport system substrate-binding protein